MSPFEIRLELLKMARDMLTEDYFGKRQIVDNDWQQQIELAKQTGSPSPSHPGYPAYPNEAEIIGKATALNNFVSQIPIENPKGKKST